MLQLAQGIAEGVVLLVAGHIQFMRQLTRLLRLIAAAGEVSRILLDRESDIFFFNFEKKT